MSADNRNAHEWKKLSEDDKHTQISTCLTYFRGVKENIFKVSQLSLKMYGKMSKAVHCEKADIGKNSYHKFDDSFLIPHLSKDYESFDFNWYYYKKCYSKLCDKCFVGNRRKTVHVLRDEQFYTQWQHAIRRINTNSKSE